MILHKGKQNFWSQFFLSLIAIFALPAVQGLDTPTIGRENYPNEQRQTQSQAQQTVKQTRQIVAPQPELRGFSHPVIILAQNTPHFYGARYYVQAPIRAGPHAA
ncbi:secA translation cis-regulator SecM [Caviibacterium pharyngocola]|uniref:DUF2547 domain-containing protein n=1 Tax=Caviibacterium pharyngocola TaxID=28159 RepID=A0A2M8RVP6_9PAST|nr:secA translation cis-regulator SecM [Caviibacterium pharyngocola]PJG82953.1 DUF2547 domain-containing protein [Caviibacterium pharyngocola]